jgi:hypothetical protein
MTENQLQERVLKRLRQGGGKWINVHGGPYQTPGVSDILGCYEGLFVAIELKNPKHHDARKVLTLPQREFLQQIKDNGGMTFVASDEGELFEEITRWRYALSTRGSDESERTGRHIRNGG